MSSNLFPFSTRQADPDLPNVAHWRTALSLSVQYACRLSAAHAALAHAAMKACLKRLAAIGAMTAQEAEARKEIP